MILWNWSLSQHDGSREAGPDALPQMLGNLSLALFWCQAFENSVMSVFFIFLIPYPTEITIIYNLEYFLSASLAGFREKHLPVSLRSLSHSLPLIPFGAWGYPGPPGTFSLCFLSSRERASTSHPSSDFCRRFFFLLLAIPPVWSLPLPPSLFPCSFLKKNIFILLIEIPFSIMNQPSLRC